MRFLIFLIFLHLRYGILLITDLVKIQFGEINMYNTVSSFERNFTRNKLANFEQYTIRLSMIN